MSIGSEYEAAIAAGSGRDGTRRQSDERRSLRGNAVAGASGPRPGPACAGQLHGRRRGHPLSRSQRELLDRLYPVLAVRLGEVPPADLRRLFPVAICSVQLEIGFGGGEHLVAQASAHPDVGFIGVEPFENGMAKAVAAIVANDLRNVRLFQGDARHVLAWLPPADLDRILLLYPDPWPKRRHLKRRFVSAATLDTMAGALRPGGELRFASDIANYVEWTRRTVAGHAAFELAADSATAWPGWQPTRYEQKARAAGRTPRYLSITRLPRAGQDR